ncbi:MAG: DNA internalization-related competence protein ComEC/Rec2 [Bacilli bacterium]
MKKLKIILLFSILLSRIIFSFLTIKNNYVERKETIEGYVTKLDIDSQKLTMVINADKKYLVNYYFKEKKNVKCELGDKIRVDGVVKSPTNNTVFNLFNYRKYLLSKRISHILTAENIFVVKKNHNFLYFVKQRIVNRINKYKNKDYLQAFILGNSSYIKEEITISFRKIGISHLFAVSGMHVGMIVLVLNFLLKKFKKKNFIIYPFLLFFLFLTNFTESLLRCTLFMFLSLINKKLKLKLKTINVLLITGAIIVFYNPFLLYSVGFLFSFIITFFIILSNEVISKFSNYFIKLFLVSFISFLASIPIISNNFFSINFLSPIINVFFVPFISIVVFPFSIVCFIIKPLEGVLSLFINFLETISLFLSGFNLFNVAISKNSFFVFCLYYIVLFLVIKVNFKYIFIFIIILIININSRFFIAYPEVNFIDVGQGDCTIIILPRGRVVMIDTGGIMGSSYSVSKSKTIPYLYSRGIKKIDCLILTHGDYDHAGETLMMLKELKIKKIIINNGKLNKLEKDICQKGNCYKPKDSFKIKKYSFEFLNHINSIDENENSIITYTSFYGKKLIFMGDANKNVEKKVLTEYNLGQMDILKVGHHGSKTSSDPAFIREIKPAYSVISVGKGNKFGHPNKETLNVLKKSKVLQTKDVGTVKFVFKKNMVNIFKCLPYIIVER